MWPGLLQVARQHPPVRRPPAEPLHSAPHSVSRRHLHRLQVNRRLWLHSTYNLHPSVRLLLLPPPRHNYRREKVNFTLLAPAIYCSLDQGKTNVTYEIISVAGTRAFSVEAAQKHIFSLACQEEKLIRAENSGSWEERIDSAN